MPRPQLTPKTLLAWLTLFPVSGGAAFEGARQATQDNARATLALFLLSGAIVGGLIGYTRRQSVVKGTLWGILIWPVIAMTLIIAAIFYNGSFIITVY